MARSKLVQGYNIGVTLLYPVTSRGNSRVIPVTLTRMTGYWLVNGVVFAVVLLLSEKLTYQSVQGALDDLVNYVFCHRSFTPPGLAYFLYLVPLLSVLTG